MGNNNSVKSSKRKCLFCCCLSNSTFSIDEKSYPTFDRLSTKSNRKQTSFYEDLKNPSIELIIKSNEEFSYLINRFHLNIYLKDYLNRLKNSKRNQTFKTHFSSSTIIYPCNGLNKVLTNNLQIFILTPPESIVPNLSRTADSSSKIHEQIRSRCYFIPFINNSIEPNDEENQESKSSYLFISNDCFQTGLIRIDPENIPKEFSSFISHSSEDDLCYLSSNLIQKWFQTLILVNQTCAIAKRFLIGDKNHMTCLLKEQESSLSFAALRLPTWTHPSEEILDAFSPLFLSDMEKLFPDHIHIDYEQYSFALILSHWPKSLIENYHTHPQRYSTRRWPSKDQMNIVIKKSLLLIPDDDHWRVNFDFIEEYLFELMNESTLFFYILCQQLFAQIYFKHRLIKHCFLNHCEKYGLPFSKNRMKISDLIKHFQKDLSEQINRKYLPDYFDHQINLLNPNEDYTQWFDYINRCLNYSPSSLSSFTIISNRSIILQFLFDFTEQLFRQKQSEFYLNDSILLDLHRQLSPHEQLIENIQKTLTYDFETNAELVNICLNQIRKSQTSLIFHYTWTIFIQYLHTYYNVLWKTVI